MLIITISLFLVVSVYAFECPDLTCAFNFFDGTCFIHSGDHPVSKIEFYSCQSHQRCNINDGNYAWYDTQLQKYTSGSSSLSSIPNKYTTAYCVNVDAYRQNLNNGRKCKEDYECKSSYCQFGFCRGQAQGQSCASNEDCDSELRCTAISVWPYNSVCQPLGLHGDSCTSDYDCHPKTFCWYKYSSSVVSGNKICLEKYSQEVGVTFGWSNFYGNGLQDAIYNGQFCKSGWAQNSDGGTTSKCVEILQISTDIYYNQTSPYACTATLNNNYCKYYFTGVDYFQGLCECALDNSTGYCPRPGQTETYSYIKYIKIVNENSRCHTLDRDNMEAQMECGIGNNEDFKQAVNWKMKFEKWSQTNDDYIFSCITFNVNARRRNSIFNIRKQSFFGQPDDNLGDLTHRNSQQHTENHDIVEIDANKSQNPISERTLKSNETIRWLKKRYQNTAKTETLQTIVEAKRNKDIQQIFKRFDEDQSGLLELDEINQLFISNGINLGKTNTKEFFKLLDADNSGSLSVQEFKEFLFNDKCKDQFRQIMRNVRKDLQQQIIKAKTAEDLLDCTYGSYLPFAFEDMLQHLHKLSKRRQILDQISDPEIVNQKEIAKKDLNQFLRLFREYRGRIEDEGNKPFSPEGAFSASQNIIHENEEEHNSDAKSSNLGDNTHSINQANSVSMVTSPHSAALPSTKSKDYNFSSSAQQKFKMFPHLKYIQQKEVEQKREELIKQMDPEDQVQHIVQQAKQSSKINVPQIPQFLTARNSLNDDSLNNDIEKPLMSLNNESKDIKSNYFEIASCNPKRQRLKRSIFFSMTKLTPREQMKNQIENFHRFQQDQIQSERLQSISQSMDRQLSIQLQEIKAKNQNLTNNFSYKIQNQNSARLNLHQKSLSSTQPSSSMFTEPRKSIFNQDSKNQIKPRIHYIKQLQNDLSQTQNKRHLQCDRNFDMNKSQVHFQNSKLNSTARIGDIQNESIKNCGIKYDTLQKFSIKQYNASPRKDNQRYEKNPLTNLRLLQRAQQRKQEVVKD
eukprot:403368927